MPNPYKYTDEEMDDLVEKWHTDDKIIWPFKDFIMHETRFTEKEFDIWVRLGRIPNA